MANQYGRERDRDRDRDRNRRQPAVYNPHDDMAITPIVEPTRRARKPPTPPEHYDADALAQNLAGMGFIDPRQPRAESEHSRRPDEDMSILERRGAARKSRTARPLYLMIFHRSIPKSKSDYKPGEANRHWGVWMPCFTERTGLLIDVNPEDTRVYQSSMAQPGYKYYTLGQSQKESGVIPIGNALATYEWVEETFIDITRDQEWNLWFNNCQAMVTRFLKRLASDPNSNFSQEERRDFMKTHGTKFTSDKAMAKSDKFSRGPPASSNPLGSLANLVSYSCEYCHGIPCKCGTVTVDETHHTGMKGSKRSEKSTKRYKEYRSSGRDDESIQERPIELDRRARPPPAAAGGFFDNNNPNYQGGGAPGGYDRGAGYGYDRHDQYGYDQHGGYPAPAPGAQPPQRPRESEQERREHRERRERRDRERQPQGDLRGGQYYADQYHPDNYR